MDKKELNRLIKLQEKAQQKVRDINKQIEDLKGTETLICAVCKAKPMIKDCVFIEVMHYHRGGAYEDDTWSGTKGHGDCLCGACGAHLTLPYLSEQVKLQEYFGLRACYYPRDGYSYAKGEFTVGWREDRKEFMSSEELFKHFKGLKK